MTNQKTLPDLPKAVIFTHFGSLKHEENKLDFNKHKEEFIDKYKDIFINYFKSNSKENIISLVYIYVGWTFEQYIRNFDITVKKFTIDGNILDKERELIGILKVAENIARRELKITESHLPRFHYIGIVQLISLLKNIIDVDKQLISFLTNTARTFTYDSPKFVEAVIRLARGNAPHLAMHPIIRIDEDVSVNANAIKKLIDAYSKECRKGRFYFFSGKYGNPDNVVRYDVLNDYAIRVHWFFDIGTRHAYSTDAAKTKQYVDACNTFLADFTELGATQFMDSEKYYSKNLKELLTENRKFNSPKRKSSQVISGAGLIMSYTAISSLPPFMNFLKLIVGIDDQLKRRLHEVIGNTAIDSLESKEEARFEQDRYYLNGIKKEDMVWAQTKYFERLLCGCLFRILITNLDGKPTDYSSLIGNIVKFRVTKVSEKKLTELRKGMIKQAEERYDEVIKCWQSEEFKGTLLYEWVVDKKETYKKKICNELIDDAIDYIKLVLKWPIFVRAIERLPLIGNNWLFEEVY